LFYTLKYKINIYHFHGFFKSGIFIGSLLKKKMILKTTLIGNDDFDTFASKKSWDIKYFFIKNIYKNIVLSNKLKKINSKYVDISKIELIPNGVLLPKKSPIFEEKENAFCFVGLVCERKRTYESIKYFIDNYSKEKNSKMYVVGPYRNIKNNHEFSNEYVAKCFELIKNNNLEKRIIFTDLLSKEETQNIYKKSKALLFFSKKEGMPNVVLEAMANNCIPIVSELDGVMKEIFTNKVEGFIINNYETVFIEQIENLLKNKMPYKLIQKKFSIEIIARRYKKLYEKI
jgi:glycosyltransferase involved in cell wall biosynthesis